MQTSRHIGWNWGEKVQVILLVLTVGFIWVHSLMPANASDAESSGLIIFLEPLLRFLGLTDVSPEALSHPIRKLAHFSEFAALGFQLLFLTKKTSWRGVWQAWETGFFIAFSDETIQLFSPGRSGEIRDVWIDASGVWTGVLAALLILLLLRRQRKT